MLDAYLFTIAILSSSINPFITVCCPTLTLVSLCFEVSLILVNVYFEASFSGTSMATSAFFRFQFEWNIFFYLLTFSLYVSLDLKWVFCRQYIYIHLVLYPFSQYMCIGCNLFILLLRYLLISFYYNTVGLPLWLSW